MRHRGPTFPLTVAGLALVAGCQHGNEVAPEVPVVAPPTASAPPIEGPDAGTISAPTAAVDATAPADTPPAVTPPDMSAAPAYPASALYETFSSDAARAKLIACYLPGKKRDPKLRGKVIVKFTINSDGMAKPVANEGSNLTDDVVIACVVRAIKTLHFQKPIEGSVTVVYPFIFRPTGDETLILPNAGKK